MTPSEQLVYDLCRRSALSLWSYASPRRRDGRELCDALVVFGAHIIVFSVKEIAFRETADPSVGAERWTRKAVDASVQQLAGATRELAAMDRVVRQDGSAGVALPAIAERKVHLVAVAVGGQRKIPFAGGQKEFGYVHVVDEVALRTILGELDTTPDVVAYLEAKEGFRGVILSEGEENLLALYISKGRSLPNDLNLIVVEEGCWAELTGKPEFAARKEEDEVSYWWDRTIELLIDAFKIPLEGGLSMDEHELVVRTLARENRFTRRFLAGACVSWLQSLQRGARNVISPSGVGYVFATYPRDYEREHRTADLAMRCFVARSPRHLGLETIVGLATEIYDPSGFSLDAFYLSMLKWTEKDEEDAQKAREDFGVMKEPIPRRVSLDEFPRQPDGEGLPTTPPAEE